MKERFFCKGFTLVEISIVFVIIGLLIGGLLVGQSMVSTTKIQSFIREITQFDIAIASFQTEYGTLPGDSTIMGCTVPVGSDNICDNKRIEDTEFATSGYSDTFSAEVANFWPQLQASGFEGPGGGTFSPTITTTFSFRSPNLNAPQLPIGASTSAIVITIPPELFGDPSIIRANYIAYSICNYNNSFPFNDSTDPIDGTGCVYEAQIPVADALAIDKKLDNGLANMVFNAPVNANDEIVSAHFQGAGNCTLDTINYNIDDDTAKCNLLIQILSQATGNK